MRWWVLLALLLAPGWARAEEVVIALSSNSLAYGGLRIAQQLGLFERNGLTPKIVVMDSGSAATAALVGGSAGFAGSGPGEVIAARARGVDVAIVVNCYRGLAAPVVLAGSVAAKLGPVSAPLMERFRALDGLVLAVPSATSALLAPIRTSAEAAGAKPRFVYMAQPAMASALQAGAIQGYVASSPFWTPPVQARTGVLWIDAPRGELPPGHAPSSSALLETTGRYAAAHPEAVRQLRAVFGDVARSIRDDPAGALRALEQAYPSVDREVLRIAFEHDAGNWSQPVLSEADMVQEVRLLRESTGLSGLEGVRVGDLFVK